MTLWVGTASGNKVVVDPVIGTAAGKKPVQVIWAGDPNGVPRVVFNRVYPITLTGTPRGYGVIDLAWNSAGLWMSYKLYKGTNPAPIYDGPLLQASDLVAAPGTSITYRVDAIYNGAVVASDDLVVAVPALPDLGLVVTSVGWDRVQLDWAVSGATYVLFRDGVQVWTGTGSAYLDTGRTAGVTYAYTLKVVQAGVPLDPGDTASATTLNVVPAVITLSAPAWDRVVVNWTASSPTAGLTYKLYRTGTASPIYTGTALTFTDLGRLPSVQYTYTVRTYAPSGVEIMVSAPASITTPVMPASAITVTLDSPRWDQMKVTWVAPAGFTYKVLRGATQIYSSTGSTTTDQGLRESTAYSYTVQVLSGSTVIGTSAAKSGTTDAYVVPVITLSSPSYSLMQIRWTASTEGSVDRYQLFRENNGQGNWTLLEDEPAADKARDEGVAENTDYRYLVRSWRGSTQIGGDATAVGRTRTRSWGTAAAGPAPGYGSYGTTSTKVINVEGNQINLPYSCTVTSMKQWVWGYGGNGRVEPKFGGVSFGIGYVIGPGQGWRDFATSIAYSSGVKTSGMRLGGTDWGSTQWTGWVAQNNYIMPGIYPAGSSTGYICTHSVSYWYYPTLVELRAVPWWNEDIDEDRVTHTTTWTDEETGAIVKALVVDHLTGEVITEWEAPDA